MQLKYKKTGERN